MLPCGVISWHSKKDPVRWGCGRFHVCVCCLRFLCVFSSNARYLGALVADVHNVLINGGIYGYPATSANRDGKLRLLYESALMAMIMEQAGGAGSTGRGRILDVKPTEIHQRYVSYSY